VGFFCRHRRFVFLLTGGVSRANSINYGESAERRGAVEKAQWLVLLGIPAST